ncbi:adenosylcobinamide amidohydrolase, partial [Halorubrum saccharovorum]
MFDATVREGVLRLHRPETRWLSTGWNGGQSLADAGFNVSVPEGFDRTDLGAYRDERLAQAGFKSESDAGRDGDAPTLFTGVSMEHARGACLGPVVAYATVGLSNPAMLPMDPGGAADDRAASDPERDGDASTSAATTDDPPRPGTVNLILGTTRRLADGAARTRRG